jgi:hypothetical protein
MSEYDVSEMEVEDQSEDGEITKSPHKHSPMQLSKDDTAFRYVKFSEYSKTCSLYFVKRVINNNIIFVAYLKRRKRLMIQQIRWI